MPVPCLNSAPALIAVKTVFMLPVKRFYLFLGQPVIPRTYGRSVTSVGIDRPACCFHPARAAGQPAGGGGDAVHFRTGFAEPAPDSGRASGRGVVSQEPRAASPHSADATRAAALAACRGTVRARGKPLRLIWRSGRSAGSPRSRQPIFNCLCADRCRAALSPGLSRNPRAAERQN